MTDLPVGCRLVDLTIRGDERGSLIALEEGAAVPFPIARVYYIFGTREGVTRGLHAHRDLQQLLVAVSGSCQIAVDDGRGRVEVRLDRPDQALLIQDLVWREMAGFSPDCVLMVLADRVYDERDYIRTFERFRELVAERAGR